MHNDAFTPMPDWPAEPLLNRLHSCLGTLDLHGLLSRREVQIVNRRIIRWCNREMVAATTPATTDERKDA